ncbi:MAG: biosynthetic-type acetolactate synthase large subunit [Coriobacteriia bacterium]|nr:biosynthetic-type acetolactate synthase large subunit [Coriobacteriia bacterium]
MDSNSRHVSDKKSKTDKTHKTKSLRLTGARAFVECLREQGVEQIFGYPGAVALPLFDELYDASDIKVLLPRHEAAAVHMADGYARSTGKVGVVLVTSGPGATNTVTGIANAYMDSVPVVVFTAQVATSVLGTDAFQEADITGITLPITKHSYLVKSGEELCAAISEGFHIASTGRPGPVVIDIPVDVAQAVFDFVPSDRVQVPGYKPTTRGNAKQILQAANALKKHARPVLYVGGGVVSAGASAELKELAESMEIPVATTLMARGVFPEDHHLWIGMPGMHGAKYTNYAMTEADLIIAVGVRFDDRITGKVSEFAKNAFIIHIDIDPAEIGKIKAVDVPIVGDARDILGRIVEILEKEEAQPMSHTWLEQIDEWRDENPFEYDEAAAKKKVLPEVIIEHVMKFTQERDTIYATEVGQNQMWAAQYAHPRGARTWITSGGLGAMGFGFPASIGAQIGNPNALVVCFAGDGSLQMNIQELATVSSNNIPVKIIVLNNGALGMVRQWQGLFYNERFALSTLPLDCPDFVVLAQAYGIQGLRIDKPSQIDSVLAKAFEHDGPVLVDCRIPADEMVFPMVAPGASIAQMLGGVPGEGIHTMIDAHASRKEAK